MRKKAREQMQIVIDIPEEDYERLKEYKKAPFCSLTSRTYEAISNGIPLPKGYGDLIDRNKLLRFEPKWYHLPNGDVACPKIDIENAPTIIEAESEEV